MWRWQRETPQTTHLTIELSPRNYLAKEYEVNYRKTPNSHVGKTPIACPREIPTRD